MLFIAVFCGFLAEYQLERTIEHHREEVFIQSMIEDIRDDIVLAHEQTSAHATMIAQMDSLVDLLSNYPSGANTGQLYYVARIAPRGIVFFNNDRTIQQMKNSGGFRLVRNQKASNTIMEYYREMNIMKLVEEREKEEQEDYKRLAVRVFDPVVFRNMIDGSEIKRIQNSPALLNDDPAQLKELAGIVQYLNGSLNRIMALKKDLAKTGEKLITVLEKEYQLK